MPGIKYSLKAQPRVERGISHRAQGSRVGLRDSQLQTVEDDESDRPILSDAEQTASNAARRPLRQHRHAHDRAGEHRPPTLEGECSGSKPSQLTVSDWKQTRRLNDDAPSVPDPDTPVVRASDYVPRSSPGVGRAQKTRDGPLESEPRRLRVRLRRRGGKDRSDGGSGDSSLV